MGKFNQLRKTFSDETEIHSYYACTFKWQVDLEIMQYILYDFTGIPRSLPEL